MCAEGVENSREEDIWLLCGTVRCCRNGKRVSTDGRVETRRTINRGTRESRAVWSWRMVGGNGSSQALLHESIERKEESVSGCTE